MRQIERTSQFKRDYKREQRTDPVLADVLRPVLESLASDQPLAEKYRDHALTGQWKSYRDCHLKPDLVLIYRKAPGLLSLARLGSHAEVFG
jgi:mRNA interferase YafQ